MLIRSTARARSGQRRLAADRVAGGDFGGVDDRDGARRMRALQVLGARRAQQIEAQQQVGIAVADLGRRLDGALAQDDARHHRAALLRQPGLVERDDGEAIDPRRRRQQRVDRDDAGAADARRRG